MITPARHGQIPAISKNNLAAQGRKGNDVKNFLPSISNSATFHDSQISCNFDTSTIEDNHEK
jgi:hypothetical protein